MSDEAAVLIHPDSDPPASFQGRWKSRNHVGALAPRMVVEIQKGKWVHGYDDGAPEIAATIPGETRSQPWTAWWEEQSDWVEIPGVLSFEDQQDFESNGLKVGTVNVENVGFLAQESPLGGVYHLIQAGYLSPFRGFDASAERPLKLEANEWSQMLARKARIRVWQGYGEPDRDEDGVMPEDGGGNGAWTFSGLVDDIDSTSKPDRIAITVRMGDMLTDQRLFGWAKSKTAFDPITFADSGEAEKVTTRGGGAEASSERDGYPARFVADKNSRTAWESTNHTTEGNTEWVEVRLPAGRYTDFVIHPKYDGMDVYVGLFLRDGKVDGEDHDDGWVGGGTVPGDHGGWQYLKVMRRHSDNQRVHPFGHTIVCGDNTVLRVAFRNLKRVAPEKYRAGCVRLAARERTRRPASEIRRWVLCDDVSDMVRVVLRWAGYTDWQVEDAGVRIKGKFVVNRANFLMDIIKKACEQTGFVFYMDDPPTGDSFGVPVFRRNSALEAYDGIQEIRDTDLLEGLKVKISEEPLAYNIRVRGKEAPATDDGHLLGWAGTRRIMAYYKPPWSRKGRLAGVLKHVTHDYPELKSFDECLRGAYLIALQEALAAVTATAELSGNPFLRLDSQVGILDEATGVNTRLWITNRTSDFTTGRQTRWKTSIGGAMIDTPDMVDLIEEMDADTRSPMGASDGSTYDVD